MESMKDMTLGQAKAEAVRRWGASAAIDFHPPRVERMSRGRLARYSHIVGNGASGRRASVEGQGHTWREAFANARPR